MKPSCPPLLLLCASLLLGSGCGKSSVTTGSGGGDAGVAPTGPIRIGIIPRDTPAGFWKSVEGGAKRAADELKVDLVWKAPLREGDREQRALVVESLQADGLHGLGLAPLDAKALLRPVQASSPNPIPVVILGSPLEGEPVRDFAAFVATDNQEGGRRAAYEMAHLLKGRGRIALVRPEDGLAAPREREAGFLEIVRNQPGFAILPEGPRAGPSLELAIARTERMLETLRSADGILATDETTSTAVLTVLRKYGLTGKAFVGFDGSADLLRGLEEGYVRALVMQNPDRLGYEAVKALTMAVRRRPAPPWVDTGVALITPENRRSPEIKAMLGEN